jgi:hypothetical protein
MDKVVRALEKNKGVQIEIITGRAHVETLAGRESGKNIDRQMEVSACSLGAGIAQCHRH